MRTCHKCKQQIMQSYITALKTVWHPDCFTCKRCSKKIITTNFIIFLDHPFHKECFKCHGCDLVINASYIRHEGNPWHTDCYQNRNHPKCTVCKKLINKKYYIDFWGNNYCIHHEHYGKCISCSRIVCENLTQGGMLYPDGLLICNQCCLYGVSDQKRAEKLLNEMRLVLASIGLKLNKAQTPVVLAEREELHHSSKHNFHHERPILGLARSTITRSNSKIVARNFQKILIQNNLSENHFRTIAIHELMHAWFFYHNYQDLPLFIEEGMCVLIEYIWLKNQNTQDAEYRLALILRSKDPIYGDGFQAAKKALKWLPLSELLRFIKERKKFPTWLQAFFYH